MSFDASFALLVYVLYNRRPTGHTFLCKKVLGLGDLSKRYSARLALGGADLTFFAYSPPSRPMCPPTPTQPGRVTNPTWGCPGALWEAPQEVCWLLGREPKPPA